MDNVLNSSLILGLNTYSLYIYLVLLWLLIIKNFKNRRLDFFICIILAVSMSEGLKSVFNVPRPSDTLMGVRFEGSSFPSTHTAMSYAGAFFYLFNSIYLKQLKLKVKLNKVIFGSKESYIIVFVFLFAVLVSVLRVVTGAHFMTDVYGGVVVGFISAFALNRYDIGITKLKLVSKIY